MKKDFIDSKVNRILQFQQLLLRGSILNKQDAALQFHVSEKTIQRDVELLRTFFAEQDTHQTLAYDAQQKGYRLHGAKAQTLSNSEVYAVCKILLESRSLTKDEMFPMLDKLIENCAPRESLLSVKELIGNERFHYVPPHHGRAVVPFLWELGSAIRDHKMIEITYQKTHSEGARARRLQPVGILFGEYYFYLAAFIDGINKEEHFVNPQDKAPTIYRIDKITDCKVLTEHFDIPYKDRFQEGEMRKRIQFMYGGKLETIKFAYTGPNIEAVLDRLPTARVLGERVVDVETGEVPDVPAMNGNSPPSAEDTQGAKARDGCTQSKSAQASAPTPVAKKASIIEAEVYNGNGLDMWLRSQGDWVKRE